MTAAVGDIVEVRLAEGYAYGRVVLCPAAYPPAIAFLPEIFATSIGDPAERLREATTTTLLVPLPAPPSDLVKRVGRDPRAEEVRFQVPVRDRRGRVLYVWEWDGERIVLGAARSRALPERRIVPLDRLADCLCAAGQPGR